MLISKRFYILAISLIALFGSPFLFGDNIPKPKDSTHLGPVNLIADPGQGYVISRGSHQMYCGGSTGSDWGCNFSISSTQCPSGFTPEAMFAQRWNDYAGVCMMRGYFIDDPKPYPNGNGGYSVRFRKAYANFVSGACDDKNITVTYTVMCVRTS